MSELGAYDVKASEIVVGDVMAHRTVTESGGFGRVVTAKVVEVEPIGRSGLEVSLDDHYAYEYLVDDDVVVYRPC